MDLTFVWDARFPLRAMNWHTPWGKPEMALPGLPLRDGADELDYDLAGAFGPTPNEYILQVNLDQMGAVRNWIARNPGPRQLRLDDGMRGILMWILGGDGTDVDNYAVNRAVNNGMGDLLYNHMQTHFVIP